MEQRLSGGIDLAEKAINNDFFPKRITRIIDIEGDCVRRERALRLRQAANVFPYKTISSEKT